MIVQLIWDIIWLFKFGFENDDNVAIIYVNKKIIGTMVSHIISIQRKNRQNSTDRLPTIRNSIMIIIQEQN
jgi:hypothetical protein